MTIRAKKIILILSIFLLLSGSGVYYLYKAINNAKTQLNAFIEPMYYDLANHNWSEGAFNKYLCPSTREWMNSKDNKALVDAVLANARTLGKIKSYEGVINFTQETADTEGKAAGYVLINFEQGNKIFYTKLLMKEKKWCLVSFIIGANKEDKK